MENSANEYPRRTTCSKKVYLGTDVKWKRSLDRSNEGYAPRKPNVKVIAPTEHVFSEIVRAFTTGDNHHHTHRPRAPGSLKGNGHGKLPTEHRPVDVREKGKLGTRTSGVKK